MTAPPTDIVTADDLRARLIKAQADTNPGRRPCVLQVVLEEVSAVDAECGDVLAEGLANEAISRSEMSKVLAELGYKVSAGQIGHHRRGVNGHGGRNACRCTR